MLSFFSLFTRPNIFIQIACIEGCPLSLDFQLPTVLNHKYIITYGIFEGGVTTIDMKELIIFWKEEW